MVAEFAESNFATPLSFRFLARGVVVELHLRGIRTCIDYAPNSYQIECFTCVIINDM